MADDKDPSKDEKSSGRGGSLTTENKRRIVELYKSGNPKVSLQKQVCWEWGMAKTNKSHDHWS